MADTEFFDLFDTEATLAEMDRLSLENKGINGPVAVHKIEEIQTPDNFAFATFSTGTTALQNLIGVTHREIQDRCNASKRLFELSGINRGDSILFTYPPLVNLFPYKAIMDSGIKIQFLKRSSKTSLLSFLSSCNADCIIGESAFLCSAMRDADSLAMKDLFKCKIIAAGTPLSADLAEECEKRGIELHDAYGCQEFGWLALDGIEVRNDISFMPVNSSGSLCEIIAGGLPTGDVMPVIDGGHFLSKKSKMATYRRKRSENESIVIIKESNVNSADTLSRTAKAVVRIKGKIISIASDVKVKSERTVLEIKKLCGDVISSDNAFLISSKEKTALFDSILNAQLDYQGNHKFNELWNKYDRV